jgi:type IV secretion system protein VirB1
VGTAQVNKYNFSKYGLNPVTAFDPCTNLNVGGQILQTCYLQSLKSSSNNNERDGTNRHIKRALSCYYSGKLDSTEGHKYANQVLLAYR